MTRAPPSSSAAAAAAAAARRAAAPEPGVGSQVYVGSSQPGDADEEVLGTVTSAGRGWFTVEPAGGAQESRKCRRSEIRLAGGSERLVTAVVSSSAAAAAAEEEESEGDEEEVIIRLDAKAPQKKKQQQKPVTQLQRDAARLASVRLETGLPKPSYLRFDKLGAKGGAKKASLDVKAARALALPALAAAAAAPRPPPPSKEQQQRQTQTHHKDKEAEQDAKMILMRNYIDPKRFYKSLDSLAPGFQIGTVIEGRMDTGPQGRLSRKQRKRTFVDEILADRAVRKYSKKKFSEIQQAAQSGRKGWQKRQQRKHAPKWARG